MNIHKTSPFMIEFIGTPEAGKTTTIHRLKDLLLTQKYSVNLVRESAEIVPTSFPKGSTEAHFWMRLTTARSILEIRRRGGEGRIVTYSFVKQYNKVLDSFIDSVTCPVFHLDTTNLSQDEVTMRVLARVFAKL